VVVVIVKKLCLHTPGWTEENHYDVIYLLTAIELPPGGSSTVHIYTKQYTERHKTNNT